MNVSRIFFISCLLIYPLSGNGTDSTQAKDPKIAFMSALIPGGGQVYNGKLIKALSLLMLEGLAIQSWLENASLYEFYNPDDITTYPLRKHRYLEKRNKYAWWVGFIYVYGMIDAIVDAHLSPFNEIMSSPLEPESKIGEYNE